MDITADILKELVPDEEILYPFDALNKFFYELDYTALGEDFPWLDAKIQTHSLGYVFIGACLQQIRHHHLYKLDFGDFKEYCRKALGKSYNYCLRLIQASQTAVSIWGDGFERLPACESQIRPIVNALPKDRYGNVIISDYTPSPSHLWKQVLDVAGEDGIITTKLVEAAVEAELNLTPKQQEKKQKIAITGRLNQKLSQIAITEGKTKEEVLEELIERRFLDLDPTEIESESDYSAEASPELTEINPNTQESEDITTSQNWEEDLSLLLEFHDAKQLANDYQNGEEFQPDSDPSATGGSEGDNPCLAEEQPALQNGTKRNHNLWKMGEILSATFKEQAGMEHDPLHSST